MPDSQPKREKWRVVCATPLCNHIRGVHERTGECGVALCGCLTFAHPESPAPLEVEVTTPDDRWKNTRALALPIGVRAEMARAALHDLDPYWHADLDRMVDPLADAETRNAVRAFCRALLGEGTAPDEEKNR